MYYLFECINDEWKEIGCGTCPQALEAHAIAAGVVVYGIIGW